MGAACIFHTGWTGVQLETLIQLRATSTEPVQHYQWKGFRQSGDDLESLAMWKQAGSKRTKLCSASANYTPDMDEILVNENLSQD